MHQKAVVMQSAFRESSRFIRNEYLPNFRKFDGNCVDAEVGTVAHYRNYLNRSGHYKLELAMYDELTRRLAVEANGNVRSLLDDKWTGHSRLMDAHINYIYGWFALDDWEDNSLFRGDQVAYHEMYNPQAAQRVFVDARDQLLDNMAAFGAVGLSRLENAVGKLDDELKVEVADNYHVIDLDNQHKPDVMIGHLGAKSGRMLEIISCVSETVADKKINGNVKMGLQSATEGMWLANDFKDWTQSGIVRWGEFKSGRINMPMAWMLGRLSENERQSMLSNIDFLWDKYLPTTDRQLGIEEKLDVMWDCESDRGVQAGFNLIENQLWETKTVRDLWGVVGNRLGSAMECSAQAKSSALDLYLGATMYHVGEKGMRLTTKRVLG